MTDAQALQDAAEKYTQARRDVEAIDNAPFTDEMITALDILKAAQAELDKLTEPTRLMRATASANVKTTQDAVLDLWQKDPALPRSLIMTNGDELQMRLTERPTYPGFTEGEREAALALLDAALAMTPRGLIIKGVDYDAKTLESLVKAGVTLPGVSMTTSATLAVVKGVRP